MMKDINELIATINHYENEAELRVNNALLTLEQKEMFIDDYNEYGFFVEDFFNIPDLDEVFVEAWKDYDFANSNSVQGEKNQSFARALCQIIEASDDYHKKTIDGGRSSGSVRMNSKDSNNTLKYEKLGHLVQSYASLHPNYAKMTVVSDDLGKDPKSGNPTMVVFVQMKIDGQEWWVAWHVMDPNNIKKDVDKKRKSNRLKTRMSSYNVLKSYNHPSFRKLVKNNNHDDTAEYEALEKAYRAAPANRKGDATHTMLIQKFDLNKQKPKNEVEGA